MNSSNKEMIGNGIRMQRVNYLIRRVAQSDVDCLILGETGTGKELAARKIHNSSWRKKGPFIPVNCSALSENLFESELFGHVKGAFTGAIGNKIGRFELANNGTLFLDEIGELSSAMQVKLLRTLQERQIEKVGDSKIVDINVRVIAATNRDLRNMMKEGSFREDFYYRVNVFSICLPPLRKRQEDIPILLKHFVDIYSKGNTIEVNSRVKEIFNNYIWPGNIRQLENAVRHSLVLANDTIQPHHLPEDILSENDIDEEEIPLEIIESEILLEDNTEKKQLIQALRENKGNRSKAAKVLGVSRVTIWNRMKKYDLLPKKDQY